MKYYDLHVHSAFSEGTSSLEQLAQTAKKLNYSGICFVEYFQNDDQIKKRYEEIQKVSEKVGIEIFLGFEARNPHELEVLVQKRRKFDILLAQGGDLKMNRMAVETPEVDILTHPSLERTDSGMNHVLMKLAKENNVAIEINFHEILNNEERSRSRVLANMISNASLAKKIHVPLIICSGSLSHWELRDPLELISFLMEIGLKINEAKDCLTNVPEKIVFQSRERRDKKWIAPGVKIK
jgi:ribonuclease P/MRP protein subunit RPP1